MSECWRRHDLLRAEPEAWSRVLRLQPRLATLPHLAPWAVLCRPLIVRRLTADDAAGMIPVALPLPRDCGKLRIAAELAPGEVSGRVPPRMLREVRHETPPSWQPTVDVLLEIADETGVEPRVFGSLLWQSLTGLPYLSATSDLDLLWPVTGLECAARLVRRLADAEAVSPVRLDGEVILPDGGGVQWREWRRDSSEVLLKTRSGVELRPVASLFAAGTFAT